MNDRKILEARLAQFKPKLLNLFNVWILIDENTRLLLNSDGPGAVLEKFCEDVLKNLKDDDFQNGDRSFLFN